MKVFVQKYGHMLAAIALMITTFAANTTCTWLTHQPEMPKNAKELRRF